MQNLIEPELQKLEDLFTDNPHPRENFPDGFSDPCPKYCTIIEQFVSWYFLARQCKHTESSIIQVAQDGERLQIALKAAFPERAGTFGWILMD